MGAKLNIPDGKVDIKFGDKFMWDFQQIACDQTADIFKLNPLARILIVMPTGVGKTLTVGNIINNPIVRKVLMKRYDYNVSDTLRVVFKSHRNRLLVQADRAFSGEDFVKINHIDNWVEDRPSKNKVEIIYQTLNDKIPDQTKVHLIIFDESHHEACITAQEFLETGSDYPIIGITATKDRPDQLLIKFDHIIEPISRDEAVERGLICQTDIKSIVDVSHKDKLSLAKDILTTFSKEMGQTMIFTKTKIEAKELAQFLRGMGYQAVAILDQPDNEVNNILDMFSEGKIKFLVNCMKIGEGVDVAGCTDVFIDRQVASYTLLNQLIGRASRIDDPRCVVWELINPLSGKNLDTTVVVGKPKSHEIISKKNGNWVVRNMEH